MKFKTKLILLGIFFGLVFLFWGGSHFLLATSIKINPPISDRAIEVFYNGEYPDLSQLPKYRGNLNGNK